MTDVTDNTPQVRQDPSQTPSFAWSETKWYADCTHCGAKNEVDAGECMAGTAEQETCVVCRKQFTFRAG
jgi:hypothetical protein